MSVAETRQAAIWAQRVAGTQDGVDEAAGWSQPRHAAFCVQMLFAETGYVGLQLLECGPGMVEATQ